MLLRHGLRLAPLRAALALLAGAGTAAELHAQAAPRPASDTAAAASRSKRPGRAVAQALAVNLVVNRVDAWVFGQDWAKAGPRSWSRNLREGWEWDEDAFRTNMFSHPYHGALYFNSARANGLSYWEAVPITFLGSWTWEYFGETYRPSLNDFFMTSFGGITLGEVFHRLSRTIRDNRATGSSRFGRELAAAPFDPVGGLQRLLSGAATRNAPNPEEHRPEGYVFRLLTGLRVTGDADVADSSARSATLVADMQYGDPLLTPYRVPFDVFSVRLQASTEGGLNLLRATGRLFVHAFKDTASSNHHVLAINQRYDYLSNPSQSFGAQSFEAGVYSRWRLPAEFRIRSQLFASAIALGAIDAPDAGIGNRRYDFGPGAGTRGELGLERRGVTYVTLWGRSEYLHSVSGASADHVANFGGFEIMVPVRRSLGVGLHTGYFSRRSRYSGLTEEQRQFVELRLFLALTSAGRPSPAASAP